jgi:hypothetical protein
MNVTREQLRQLYDFDAGEQLVNDAIMHAFSGAGAEDRSLRFIACYTSWNGYFGSAVAALAAKIGRARGLFRDPGFEVPALSDRSVYVASFFFDAARDEFDDRDTVHRDTHRCLAQATVLGMLKYRQKQSTFDPQRIAGLLDEPLRLHALNSRVARGYGVGTPDDLPAIFEAIGYHLGSEVLADKEFSVIDASLRAHCPGLVEHLKSTEVEIAGQRHNTYQWIAIHSGHGSAVEADHFGWATQGAKLAFRFVPEPLHADLRSQLDLGFQAFARDHREFFSAVLNNEY